MLEFVLERKKLDSKMLLKAIRNVGVCLIVLAAGRQAFAQGHYHSVPHTTTHYDMVRHGNHYHRVPHTTTHYDHVYHNGPDYYPTYPSYPNYSSSYPSQVIVPSSPVINSSPSVVYSAPSISTPSTSAPSVSSSSTNVALKPNLLPYNGPGVKIRLPKELGGEVSYILDKSIPGEIRAGMEQHLTKKKSFEIRFSRGVNSEGVDLGEARYTISEGLYAFAITDKGWDLFRQPDAPSAKDPTATEPPLKANKLPTAVTPKEVQEVDVPSKQEL